VLYRTQFNTEWQPSVAAVAARLNYGAVLSRQRIEPERSECAENGISYALQIYEVQHWVSIVESRADDIAGDHVGVIGGDG